jgi:hypothetical protein
MCGQVIVDRVVGEGDIGASVRAAREGVAAAFLPIGDDRGVLTVWSLLDRVAGDRGVAAVRQIDGVGRGAVVVSDRVAGDRVVFRTRLDLVAGVRVVDIAVGQRELVDVADVDVMRVAGCGAVVTELGLIDGDGAVRIRGAQQAVLVLVKTLSSMSRMPPS